MTRVGWKRYIIASFALLLISAPLGETGATVSFAVVGIASVVALIQGPRHHGAPRPSVWYLLAAALVLFLAGGVAEGFSPISEGPIRNYPTWREPFDLAAYGAVLIALGLMARARLANRDRTNTLDALIGVCGIGALVWSTIMTEFLQADSLTTAGKTTGVLFSLMTLALGFTTIRVAIGPGARPPAYYFLALAAAGGFLAEVFVELELIGRTPFPGTDILSALASATAFIMIAAAALHPSMPALTMPPEEAMPNMTGRRLLAMTAAVLIPPALLLAEQTGETQIETVIIIGVWAVVSIMVMVRVYSLAQGRERIAAMDRALASADARLAAARDEHDMAVAVLEAANEIVSGVVRAAVFSWHDDHWNPIHSVGSTCPSPLDGSPQPATAQRSRQGDTFAFDVHFDAVGSHTGVVSLEARTRPDELELGRLTSLVSDLGRALESAALREQVGRDRSERRFRSLVENSADIIVVLTESDTINFVSPAGPRLLGFDEAELLGRTLEALVETSHRPGLASIITKPDNGSAELQLICRDGSLRWFDVTASDMRSDEEISGIVVTASEISVQKQAQLDLRRSEARFRSLVQHSSDLVAVLDGNGMISWISPSSQPILGVAPPEALDRDFMSLAHPSDRETLSTLIARMSLTESVPQTSELRVRHASGSWRILEVTVTNLLNDPSVEGIVLNAHDITERKTLEQNLRHQALHDDLTGIANRVLFRDRVHQALTRREDSVVVLVVDLDDFKTVNDGLGTDAGDELLKVLSFRLQQFLRGSDTAARLGGDEFAILLEGNPARSEVTSIAQRLLQTIEVPIDIAGREIVLHASIGVAFADDLDEATPETLMRSADLAMHGAKNRGKSRVVIFDESMHEGAFERLELKADLARALQRRELLLHYQPVVDLATGAISGFEALMRWNHAERKMVGPGVFIPLAEETGLIVPIGRWLIDEALEQLRIWQDEYPNRPPLTMSINVSGRQLEDPSLVDDIDGAIKRLKLDPSTVIIELTESVVVEESPRMVRRLKEIRELGVGLYADDFGAGFASYSALQSLPFSGVKIDRSLVIGLDGESSDRAEAQVRSIIEMAAETDMRVVAEGIESGAQAHALRGMQCEKAQGFYFERPAPVELIGDELNDRDLLSSNRSD